MNIKDLNTNVFEAAEFLKALANPYRLLVLCELHNGEKSVRELEAIAGLSQSALSQHLARLRKDGMVATRRQSQTIYYSLAHPGVQRVMAVLHNLYCAPNSLP